jgi:hypothetical protein
MAVNDLALVFFSGAMGGLGLWDIASQVNIASNA